MTALDAPTLELLRETLLRAAAASAPCAITLAIARLQARIAGHQVDDERLLRELDFLASSGLLAPVPNPMSGASKLFKITAAGTLFAEEKGLV